MINSILTDETFDNFTYSKRSHFDKFSIPKQAKEYLNLDIDEVPPKVYQDLFIYNLLLKKVIQNGEKFSQ